MQGADRRATALTTHDRSQHSLDSASPTCQRCSFCRGSSWRYGLPLGGLGWSRFPGRDRTGGGSPGQSRRSVTNPPPSNPDALGTLTILRLWRILVSSPRSLQSAGGMAAKAKQLRPSRSYTASKMAAWAESFYYLRLLLDSPCGRTTALFIGE